MGAVKDDMKTSKIQDLRDKVKDGLKGLVGKKAADDPHVAAKTFADMILEADTKLVDLIKTKQSDLTNEAGDESYNRKALAVLKGMQFHLDEIANMAEEYVGLRK